MTEAELIRLIKRTVREEVARTLMGTVVSNESQERMTIQRFSTETPIGNVRRIQPYGFGSRAPANTPTLIIPVNGDATHLNSVGDFDSARPSMNDGECLLYDAHGHVVYLSETKMQFGSKSSAENMVLGQVFKTMMDTLLTAIETHTHIGNLGYDTSPPKNATDFANIKASPIDDNAILSDKAFTEK